MAGKSKETPEQMADRVVGEDAESEAVAHLEIVRALKPFGNGARIRIIQATASLLEADAFVPGIIEAFVKGHSKMTNESPE